MEKINFIFRGESKKIDLSFMKSVINIQNDKTYINIPELGNNNLSDYYEFKNLFNNEKELFVCSNTKFLDFFASLKPNFESYIDIYKNVDETTFLITSFFEGYQLELDQDTAVKRFDVLFCKSKEFVRKYKFDEYYCQLYEDDDDCYFSHNGYGNLYNQLDQESFDII